MTAQKYIPWFSLWHYCFIGQGYFEYGDKSLKDYIVTWKVDMKHAQSII